MANRNLNQRLKFAFLILLFIVFTSDSTFAIRRKSNSNFKRNTLHIHTNEYGLKVNSRFKDYIYSLKKDSNNALVDLRTYLPDAIFDIKYATKDNFMSKQMYKRAAAYTRLPVAKALAKINGKIKEKGYKLKIFDAYRPYSVTIDFYLQTKDTNFVASPWSGSRHNRGCAVDLTICDSLGNELEMPTAFDDFTEKAHPNFQNANPIAIQNRDYLISTMENYGFKVYPSEWWHFDFVGWEKYDLMDIRFDDL